MADKTIRCLTDQPVRLDEEGTHIAECALRHPSRYSYGTSAAIVTSRRAQLRGIIVAFPGHMATVVATAWGVVLLGALTYVLSRARRVPAWREIAKHLIVAVVVIAVSPLLGSWITAVVSA
jgi:hypothetical protein